MKPENINAAREADRKETEQLEADLRSGLSFCCRAPIDSSRVLTEGRHKGHGPRICSKCRKVVFYV